MTSNYFDGHDGHDWGHPNLDRLGVFFISFAVIYTAVVLASMFALFKFRKTHAIRIRSFSVIAATVLTLHVYLVLILIAYPLNGLYKCGYEYWIMNILLPLGIALFQASNMRLFSYASEQKEISEGKLIAKKQCYHFSFMRPCPIEWARHHNLERRTYGLICIGGAIQLIIALVIYFGSRKFHSDYGFFSQSVDPNSCRRGTEWVPSVVWQFLWATVFGPYVLLRIRDINDTHYWAWQTRLAIIACLPGTPLWLTFIYSNNPQLVKINQWFVPSGWFLPGLIMMQFVSMFFPLLDVYKLKVLERQFGKNRDEPQYGFHEKKTNPYSMATLEMQLAKNPTNLLYWAYTKEFTAENIMFLTAVRDFKRKWDQTTKHTELLNPVQLRERYEEAAMIYFRLVNPETARMNINIDSHTFRELEKIFKSCHYEPVDDSSSLSKSSSTGTENVVTPWDEYERPRSTVSHQSDEGNLTRDVDKLYPLPVTEIHAKYEQGAEHENDAEIPANFGLEVFDRAYETVKNDVYLNTWVRFINRERIHDSRDSDSLHSDVTRSSEGSPRKSSLVGPIREYLLNGRKQ